MKLLAVPFSSAILAAACSGRSSEPAASTSSALTGPVEVRITEDLLADRPELVPAPVRRATKVVVTIDRVDARIDDASGDDAWTTLSLATRTVDLLDLPDGGFASLGVTKLPAGGIERLRLFVSPAGPNEVVTSDGVTHPLAVPSDEIRIVGDFDAGDCVEGQVTLAFAGRRSIDVHPLGGATASDDTPLEWVLRPVIRVREVELQGSACAGEDGPGQGNGSGDNDRGRW